MSDLWLKLTSADVRDGERWVGTVEEGDVTEWWRVRWNVGDSYDPVELEAPSFDAGIALLQALEATLRAYGARLEPPTAVREAERAAAAERQRGGE